MPERVHTPHFSSKAVYDLRIANIEKAIEERRDAAAGWASIRIHDLLNELHAMFPEHEFVFTALFGGCAVDISPPLYGQALLEDLEGDIFADGDAITPQQKRLSEIEGEIRDIALDIEERFARTLGAPGTAQITRHDDDGNVS